MTDDDIRAMDTHRLMIEYDVAVSSHAGGNGDEVQAMRLEILRRMCERSER